MIPRSVRYALSGISWPVYVLLYTPLALVAYYSFGPAPNQTGHSLHAYQVMAQDPSLFVAFQRSFILALGSAITSTALGTLLGYGLCRFRNRGAKGILANLPSLIIYTPIISASCRPSSASPPAASPSPPALLTTTCLT